MTWYFSSLTSNWNYLTYIFAKIELENSNLFKFSLFVSKNKYTVGYKQI